MAPGPVWMGTKISPLPGIDLRTVQPVATRYSGYATVVHEMEVLLPLFLTSALDGSEGLASRPGRIAREENPT